MAIVEVLYVVIALLVGCLIGLLKSYHSEKGKNLATKEDIEDITRKIEGVKADYQKSFVKSEGYISRQLQAYDEISDAIMELRIHCFRESQESEHAVPYAEIPQKSAFQRAMLLRELGLKHEGFIGTELSQKIDAFSQNIFMMGHMEMYADHKPEALDKGFYSSVLTSTTELLKDMREELFEKVA